jgi:hypothetical protein
MEVFHYELLIVHSVEIKHATVAFTLSFLTPFHPDCYMYYFQKRLSVLFRIELQPMSARETLNVSIKTVLE